MNRKSITLMGLLGIAVSSTAQPLPHSQPHGAGKLTMAEFVKRAKADQPQKAALQATAKPYKNAPWKNPPTEQPITEQPEGTLYKNMYRSSEGIYDWGGGMYSYQTIEGMASDFVINESTNEVFLKNPFSTMATDTWIKGQKANGDTLEFKFPQYITRIELAGYGSDYYACRLVLDTVKTDYGTEYVTYVPATDNQTVKFTWRNDSLVKIGNDLLGMATAEGAFAGYGDNVTVMHPVKEPQYRPATPGNAEGYALYFPLNDGQTDVRVVKGVTEGDDIYMQGLDETIPEAWVKGTIADNKVEFPAMQYFGVDSSLALPIHKFFAPIDTVKLVDPITGYSRDSVFIAEKLVFDYDADTRTLKSDKGFAPILGDKAIDFVVQYHSMTFEPWTEVAATPTTPTITSFDYSEQDQWGELYFEVAKKSTEGNVIDDTKMWLNFFVDDDIYVFDPYAYEGILNEEATDVPLLYSDMYYFEAYGRVHRTSLYLSDGSFERIGVQVIYEGGGETRKSDIAYYDHIPQGIASKTKSNGQPVAVSYVGPDGRLLSKPIKGLNIMRTTHSDGTVSTTKVILR